MSIGLTFDEIMKGSFAMGEAEPEAGAASGKKAGLILQMDATVVIDDLDRFVDDPDHAGNLAGSISYEPLGEQIPSRGGVFNLFSPGEQPALKLMVYELGMEVDGAPYYFAGRKEVRNNSGSDLWSDTTTLYSTIHAGGDKNAPVAGAGIIRLGLGELKDLLMTMRVTGTDSPAEQLRAMTKFGSFFLGELWDTYAPFAKGTA